MLARITNRLDTIAAQWLQRYQKATTRARDLRTGERGVRTGDAELIASFVQVVGIAASRIADVAACNEIKLYARASDRRIFNRIGVGTRSVGKQDRPWLTGQRKGLYSKAVAYSTEADGDVIELDNSPLQRLIDNPAHPSIVTSQQLYQWVYLAMQIAGRAPVMVHKAGADSAIVPLMPHHLRPILDTQVAGRVEAYSHGVEETDRENIPADQVVIAKHTIAFDHLVPRGPVHNIITESALMRHHADAEASRWKNGARPESIIKMPQSISQEEVDESLALIRETMTGPHNAGRVALPSGWEIKPSGFSPREMDYVTGITRLEQMILAAFGLPEAIYRLNDSNRAGADSARWMMAEYAIVPMMNKLCDAWTASLVPMFGYEPGDVWFGFSPVVPEDTSRQKEEALREVAAGVLTAQEYRARFNINRDSEEADTLPENLGEASKLRIGAQALGETASNPLDSLFSARPAEPAALPPAPAPTPSLENSGTRAAGTGAVVRAAIVGMDYAAPDCQCGNRAKIKAGLGPLDPDRQIMVDAARAFRQSLSGWYRFALDEGTGPGGLLTPQALTRLEDIMSEALPSLYGTGRRVGAEAIDVDPESFTVPPNILDTYQTTLTATVSRSYEDIIRPIIAEGAQDGKTVAEVITQLREEAPDLEDYAAERIARSETARATEQGSLDLWEQAGVQQKEWILAAGACPICTTFYANLKAAGRTIIPMRELFANAGDSWTYTPEGGGAPRTWVQKFPMPGARTHPQNRSTVVAVSDSINVERAAKAMLKTLDAMEAAWNR